MLDLVISIVNTNNKQLLKNCLDSIISQTKNINYEIWIVDNASKDGSFEMLKMDYVQVKVVCNKEKLGFSENHNKILKNIRAEYKLILNEDTVILDNAINKLINFIKTDDTIGAVGPALIFANNEFQHSAFYFPTVRNEIAKALSDRVFSEKARGVFPQKICSDTIQAQWLNGACILFNSKALEKIGYLDENFFIFYEEVDICRRLYNNSWKIYYYPYAKCIHLYGQSTKDSKVMNEILKASRIYYFKKYKGIFSAYFLETMLLCIKILKWLCRPTLLIR